ncbi:MAG TPA: helix-turn-helix transcriptional regulator [Blastocatellia bacterium]|jgi:molybdopterin-binding protein|nr:helix-turn-helix transcriptional regulator [Blastocatellia bacterium]
MELLRLHEAAKLVGVSYPTLKQWIYNGKIKSVKTAGGHHRIPRSEVERLVGSDKRKSRKKPVGLDAISGRNKLFGKITEMRYDGLLAQVSIEIGGQTITSIITSDAARALDLKKGVSVYALVKSTEVMVIRG